MMCKHKAEAVNWNGKSISVTFKAKAEDIETLARKAHKAFHNDGRWTIQLRTVDGIKVAAEFEYSK